MAEPIPLQHEDPFFYAVWDFIKRYRKLRHEFREVSQSRASLKRRLDEWHVLIDDLIQAYDDEEGERSWSPTMGASLEAIRQYRYEKKAVGWR